MPPESLVVDTGRVLANFGGASVSGVRCAFASGDGHRQQQAEDDTSGEHRLRGGTAAKDNDDSGWDPKIAQQAGAFVGGVEGPYRGQVERYRHGNGKTR